MTRREWLNLAMAACVPSCAARGKAMPGNAAYGIWENGRLRESRDPGGRLGSLSLTKAVAALAVVRAAGEGWLDFDEPLTNTIPEWRNDPKSRITVRMLVNQAAGFTAGVPALYRGKIADKGRVAIALPLVNSPGEIFRYGPASSEVLAEVLRRRLLSRGKTVESLLKEVMGRIGISSPNWREDGAKRYYLSTGAEFSVHHLGKLGQVIGKLANGQNTAGLDASIFRNLASPRSANPMVAAGIWWNRNAAKPGAFAIDPERELDETRPPAFWQRACLSPAIDRGWLAMVGSGGKRVYVLPARGLVIARLGRSSGWNDGAYLSNVAASR